MNDLDFSPTLYRHTKIAELLAIFWEVNNADSDNHAPDWTRPAMAGTVCNPLMKAVRALLEADFYIYDDANDFAEEVITRLIDAGSRTQTGESVSKIVAAVIADSTATHTKLATIAGIDLYEHCEHGDEAPMLMRIRGQFKMTGLYAEPDIDPIEVKQEWQQLQAVAAAAGREG